MSYNPTLGEAMSQLAQRQRDADDAKLCLTCYEAFLEASNDAEALREAGSELLRLKLVKDRLDTGGIGMKCPDDERAEYQRAKPLAWDALRAALSSDVIVKVHSEGPARWRHVKRGTVYESVGEARAQCAESIRDGDKLQVYRAEDDGGLWCRPVHEFLDGRFEAVERKQGHAAGNG